MKWINLSEEAGLNKKAYKELPVGKILIFNYEGSKTYIKIMRKHKGIVWGKEIQTYSPDEIDIVDV